MEEYTAKEEYIRENFDKMHKGADILAGRAILVMAASVLVWLITPLAKLAALIGLSSFCGYLFLGEMRRAFDTRPDIAIALLSRKYDAEMEQGLRDMIEETEEEVADTTESRNYYDKE